MIINEKQILQLIRATTSYISLLNQLENSGKLCGYEMDYRDDLLNMMANLEVQQSQKIWEVV